MGVCRLCTKSSLANGRLADRFFREKVLDIICMWVDVNDARQSKDVCDSCFNLVEKFYSFKRDCRSFQLASKEQISSSDKKSTPNEACPLVIKFVDPAKVEKASKEEYAEVDSEDEFFRNLPPLKKPKKKYVTRKSPKPPKVDVNGERIVVPRPWRRKFKEAIDLPPDEYRQYVQGKTNPKKPTVVCELCGRTIDICRIDGHRNRHMGLEPYECDVCGDKFNCKYNLRTHHRRNHVKGEECTCSTCGKLFISRLALQSHMKSVHAERKFACSLCPLKFGNRSTLNYHLKIHNQTRDFKCPLCGKAFYCKSVWNIHMRTHSGEAPYRCSVCSAAYVHRNMYVAHMNKNHPGEPLMYLSGKKSFKESLLNKGV
ncbi:zinc finger protein 62 homolog [Ochlerotatus camptorhynchus]|uniref:zinc finger protein 62 homolog n=1 Tax=Ochlerotatus camptorhynchus TaxID=644619 RepID=UPI0031DCA72D